MNSLPQNVASMLLELKRDFKPPGDSFLCCGLFGDEIRVGSNWIVISSHLLCICFLNQIEIQRTAIETNNEHCAIKSLFRPSDTLRSCQYRHRGPLLNYHKRVELREWSLCNLFAQSKVSVALSCVCCFWPMKVVIIYFSFHYYNIHTYVIEYGQQNQLVLAVVVSLSSPSHFYFLTILFQSVGMSAIKV